LPRALAQFAHFLAELPGDLDDAFPHILLPRAAQIIFVVGLDRECGKYQVPAHTVREYQPGGQSKPE